MVDFVVHGLLLLLAEFISIGWLDLLLLGSDGSWIIHSFQAFGVLLGEGTLRVFC